MPLINQSVPNLIQGVSQQPDAVRFEGQCEDQLNGISSIVDGLTKRQSTEIRAHLQHAVNEDDIVHFINRSETEQYVITLSNGKLRATNLSNSSVFGTTCIFTNNIDTNDNNNLFADVSNIPYFSGLDKNNSKLLTVADNTFVVNKTQAVQPLTTKTPKEELEALYYIKQGDYDKDYKTEVKLTRANVIPNTNNAYTYKGYGADITYTTLFMNFVGLAYSDKEEYQRVDDMGATGYLAEGTTISVTTTSGSSFNNVNEIGYSFTYDIDSIEPIEDPELTFTLDANGQIASCTVTKAGAFKLASNSGYNIFKLYIFKIDPDDTTVTTASAVYTSNSAKSTTTSNDSGAARAADTNVIALNFGTSLYTDIIEDSNGKNFDGHSAYKNRFYRARLGSNLFELRPNKGLMMQTDKDNPDNFKVTVSDGLAGEGLGLVYREVDSITDLPVDCKNGFKVKVGGDLETGADDYYVKFKTTGGGNAGKGTWQETVGFDISKGIDKTTMPVRIINTGLNQFTLDYCDWDEREAGDDDTNPHPSFVSPSNTDLRYIENIFFFKNRLGFLSRDNIIMSEAGEPFNFYRTTVASLIDSAPIDIQVSSPEVVNLKNAVGFQENLIVFSEKGQFVMKGGDILTTKTVSVTPITNFENDSSINPIALGSYIYFPVKRDNFYGFQEFTVNASTDVYDSNEITEHVPKYIPDNIIGMVGSSSENAIAVVSKGNTGEQLSNIYVYRYFFSNNKKLLSSWFKFSIYGTIRGMDFMGSNLNILISQNDVQTYHSGNLINQASVLSLPFSSTSKTQEGGFNHLTNLDFRYKVTINNQSSIALGPVLYPNNVVCYKDDGTSMPITQATVSSDLGQGTISATSITFTDGPQTGTFYVGVPFDFRYTFSELVFKDSKGQGGTPTNSTRFMLKNGTIFFDDTHTFQTKVTPKNRNVQLDTFSATTVGDTITGQLDVSDGSFRFPIFANADDTTISVIDSTPFPIKINSAEFEALVKPRSKRIG
jgi:hypothetical protein